LGEGEEVEGLGIGMWWIWMASISPSTMRENAIRASFRQRTDQIDVFTTEMSCLTIVWATMQGITWRKVPVE
jgi:hypothetical protein